MKVTLYRDDFKTLNDGTDCFNDMLISQFHCSINKVEDINEIDIDAEIEDIR